MRREDVIDVLNRLPDNDQAKIQIVLRSGRNVSIDTVMRLEDHYTVVRGRESGNQDEGRVFFIPYAEMVCLKLERIVNMEEIETWYNDTPSMAKKDATATPRTVSPEPEPLDPAEIARQNLLERIRAARSVVSKR